MAVYSQCSRIRESNRGCTSIECSTRSPTRPLEQRFLERILAEALLLCTFVVIVNQQASVPQLFICAGQALVLPAELHHKPLCLSQLLCQLLWRHSHLIAAAIGQPSCRPGTHNGRVPTAAPTPHPAWPLLLEVLLEGLLLSNACLDPVCVLASDSWKSTLKFKAAAASAGQPQQVRCSLLVCALGEWHWRRLEAGLEDSTLSNKGKKADAVEVQNQRHHESQ